MLDAYLYHCDPDRPLRETVEELAAILDDEWGLLLVALLSDPLSAPPEWLDEADRSTFGRIGYCLLSDEPVYPIP